MKCGLAADSEGAHQADNRLPAMRLRSLWYPYPSLRFLSVQPQAADRQGQCCMQLLSDVRTLDWTGLDGAATPIAPLGREGAAP